MKILMGLLAVFALVELSYALTNWGDRRRSRGRLTLATEHADPPLTILAKRRAERARQAAVGRVVFDPYIWN